MSNAFLFEIRKECRLRTSVNKHDGNSVVFVVECNDGRALEHAVKDPPRAPPAWFNRACSQRSALDVQTLVGLPDISNAI